MVNTFDDYILAVRSKYEVEKNKIYSDFLLKPSPAQMRELCLLIHDKGLSNKDKEVFELFFRTKPDSTLRKAIENIDVEKLKKICNFLNGKSQSTSPNSLNLIAILVDFEPRPFKKFYENSKKEDAKPIRRMDKAKEVFEKKSAAKKEKPEKKSKKRNFFRDIKSMFF